MPYTEENVKTYHWYKIEHQDGHSVVKHLVGEVVKDQYAPLVQFPGEATVTYCHGDNPAYGPTALGTKRALLKKLRKRVERARATLQECEADLAALVSYQENR